MSDAQFAGSIPAIYDEFLVPVLFEPYAADLVRRVADLAPVQILELACGTGAVSRRLAETLPSATITATDLNPAMLDVATMVAVPENLAYASADAQDLNAYAADTFDLVLAQFGAMFFPEKVRAYREARRLLRTGGTFLFSVWDSLEANPASHAIHLAVREVVPEPKPEFIARTPFGYNDVNKIEQQLRAAGFEDIIIERVELRSPPKSAERLARGMCLGSPLANELALHPQGLRDRALAAAIEAAKKVEAAGPLTMSALVIAAR